MTDLAKLASEITPGPWEFIADNDLNGEPFGLISIEDGNRVIADIRPVYGKELGNEDAANGEASALVPELIAEVLQLREENASLRTEVDQHDVLMRQLEIAEREHDDA